MQDCSISIAKALEILESCTKPSICTILPSHSCLFYWLFSSNFHFPESSFRHALLEEQTIAPELDHNPLLLNTDEQDLVQQLDSAFEQLEPPLEDYMFSLEQGEGISDLFDVDAFDFQSLWKFTC